MAEGNSPKPQRGVRVVNYETTEALTVPANGIKELGTFEDIVGGSFPISGYIRSGTGQGPSVIVSTSQWGGTNYITLKNVSTGAQTIASGTTIQIVVIDNF